jgi:hypothetical protein
LTKLKTEIDEFGVLKIGKKYGVSGNGFPAHRMSIIPDGTEIHHPQTGTPSLSIFW